MTNLRMGPGAQLEYLIRCKRFSNSVLTLAKLQRHLKDNHFLFLSKTILDFKQIKSNVQKPKPSFLEAKKTHQKFLLISYRLCHHVLKRQRSHLLWLKKLFNLHCSANCVVSLQPALQTVANQLLDEKYAQKLQQIRLPDCTESERRFRMAEDLIKQFINKKEKASCYGLLYNWINQLILKI